MEILLIGIVAALFVFVFFVWLLRIVLRINDIVQELQNARILLERIDKNTKDS